ncbi:MAG: hypothetical protein A2675_01350 [Candidatus Yonathbacteria bacterium RIFCSPHIGHO2_01_FULL_51_10]|uniref:Immunity MXAN-0049 protein domain-containing protein n=1 Tax=Candidatus Yonathbacteria bacterium RIFCSPHIGHO2_01_FULL_51_10 TaxID=1802723 RepID=A0A1G2S5N1_9BACT|nr:MAG: hypothetical protein A2675_01350 [Candidatus Yonathbacteria bacterium RIFCSPHIGHO2_01_FULL_51_10]
MRKLFFQYMSHYYILKCPLLVTEDGEALIEIHNEAVVGSVWDWRDGKALEQEERQSIPNPISIDVDYYRGYQGQPVELFDVGTPLMSKRLADAFVEAGVHNVEFFPAVLKNKVTGETYDYCAFKVVGLVAAADLEKSKWESYDNKLVADTSFEHLVLDEVKAAGSGFLVFRLAENINALMVHEKICDAILTKGINTLKFVEPKDWVQA